MGRSALNAHLNKDDLGWAKITHPFHPFHGQQFKILQIKKIAGKEILSLKHSERGSFAVQREWTDQNISASYIDAEKDNQNFFSFECLQDLIHFLEIKIKKEVDK